MANYTPLGSRRRHPVRVEGAQHDHHAIQPHHQGPMAPPSYQQGPIVPSILAPSHPAMHHGFQVPSLPWNSHPDPQWPPQYDQAPQQWPPNHGYPIPQHDQAPQQLPQNHGYPMSQHFVPQHQLPPIQNQQPPSPPLQNILAAAQHILSQRHLQNDPLYTELSTLFHQPPSSNLDTNLMRQNLIVEYTSKKEKLEAKIQAAQRELVREEEELDRKLGGLEHSNQGGDWRLQRIQELVFSLSPRAPGSVPSGSGINPGGQFMTPSLVNPNANSNMVHGPSLDGTKNAYIPYDQRLMGAPRLCGFWNRGEDCKFEKRKSGCFNLHHRPTRQAAILRKHQGIDGHWKEWLQEKQRQLDDACRRGEISFVVDHDGRSINRPRSDVPGSVGGHSGVQPGHPIASEIGPSNQNRHLSYGNVPNWSGQGQTPKDVLQSSNVDSGQELSFSRRGQSSVVDLHSMQNENNLQPSDTENQSQSHGFASPQHLTGHSASDGGLWVAPSVQVGHESGANSKGQGGTKSQHHHKERTRNPENLQPANNSLYQHLQRLSEDNPEVMSTTMKRKNANSDEQEEIQQGSADGDLPSEATPRLIKRVKRTQPNRKRYDFEIFEDEEDRLPLTSKSPQEQDDEHSTNQANTSAAPLPKSPPALPSVISQKKINAGSNSHLFISNDSIAVTPANLVHLREIATEYFEEENVVADRTGYFFFLSSDRHQVQLASEFFQMYNGDSFNSEWRIDLEIKNMRFDWQDEEPTVGGAETEN